jgi:uncharacterized membrane protein YccC
MAKLLESRRHQEAFKVGLAALLAALIILSLHADNPFWAPALVIVFMSEYFESSLKASIERIVSSIFGGVFAMTTAHFTLHNEFFYIAVLCFVVAFCVYSFLVYGSGWLNFAVTFSFIYLYLMYYPQGGFDLTFWRIFQVTLAAVIWVFVSAYFFPNHARASAVEQFCQTLATYAHLLETKAYTDKTTWENAKNHLSKLFLGLTKAVNALPSSGANTAKFIAAGAAVDSLKAILRAIDKFMAVSDFMTETYAPFFSETAQAIRDLISNSLKRVNLEAFRESIERIVSNLTDYNIKTNELMTHERLLYFYEALLTLTDQLIAWLYGSAVIDTKIRKNTWRKIWHDLRSRPERVRHSVCAGLGCGLIIIIWFTTSSEGGICAVISALVVGADFSLTKINLKIRLRLYGSFTGSFVAFLLVIFVTKNIALLLICVFGGVMLFGYLATGNFKEMYFSWMATMSYVITLIPSNTIENNFDFMVERSVGLLFGLAVMLFVMNFFFQINPDEVMKRHRRRMLGKIAEFFQLLVFMVEESHSVEALKKLDQVILFLREQATVSDTLAQETGHVGDWEPIRDILLHIFWCYRFLLKTPILSGQLLNPDEKIEFIEICNAAAAHLHPHLAPIPWPLKKRRERATNDAATALFLTELNVILLKIQSFEPEIKNGLTPSLRMA